MPAFVDLTGARFGRLTVSKLGERDRHGRPQWLCTCECGGQRLASNSKLKTGHVRSCGCARTENAKRAGAMNRTHGHAKPGAASPTYKSWMAMWTRCTWKKHAAYDRYGGRGIIPCVRWESFAAFLEDMGERPANRTLDRIDNDRGYSKSNCRWATRSEQQLNRRGYGDSSSKRL